MNEPGIVFTMQVPVVCSPKMLYGTLVLKTVDNKAGIRIRATSGTKGNQYLKSWRLKGQGCIPPSSNTISYKVSTNRLWLPNVKGVEGSFYAISPFTVNIDGYTRGDFGIHYDANVPGSAGCIVVPSQEHWDIFRGYIDSIRSMGIKEMALTTMYNQ